MNTQPIVGECPGASKSPAEAIRDPAALKRIATARARAALRGIVLHVLSDDGGRVEFVVTQGFWTRSFTELEFVETWLDRIEGRKQ